MKNIFYICAASFACSIIGSILLAFFLGGLGLWMSIFVVAFPVCMLLGFSAVGPWATLVKNRKYSFSILSGLFIGGIFGGGIMLVAYVFSPQAHFSNDIVMAALIWILMGALFGVIYSVILKFILLKFSR